MLSQNPPDQSQAPEPSPACWSEEPIYERSFDLGSLALPAVSDPRIFSVSRGEKLVENLHGRAQILSALFSALEAVKMETPPIEVRKQLHGVSRASLEHAGRTDPQSVALYA